MGLAMRSWKIKLDNELESNRIAWNLPDPEKFVSIPDSCIPACQNCFRGGLPIKDEVHPQPGVTPPHRRTERGKMQLGLRLLADIANGTPVQ